MFRPYPVVSTDNGFILFTKSRKTGRPLAYVKLDVVLDALNAMGIDNGEGVLSRAHNEALVELANFARVNGF